MRRAKLCCLVVAAAVSGCGGVTTTAIGFGPIVDPIAPGERAEHKVTVRYEGAGGPWAGRQVRMTAAAPADVAVEPAEAEVTLDGGGSGAIKVFITPAKGAAAGPRTIVFTADAGGGLSTSLSTEIAVK